MEIPNGTAPVVDATGEIAVDTTSGQLKYFDGLGAQIITATTTKSFNVSSTTLDAYGNSFSTGSSTFLLMNNPEATTLLGYYCVASSTGSVFVEFTDGANATTISSCSTGSFTETTSNNAWIAFENFMVIIGGQATDPSRVTITTVTKPTAD